MSSPAASRFGKAARETRGPTACTRSLACRATSAARQSRRSTSRSTRSFTAPNAIQEAASSRIGGFRACFGSDKLGAVNTVADLMVKDVLTVDPSDTIGEAAEKMNAANVGAVVVVEDFARIVGIVTERDLMRAVAARARAAEARVRQWMTPDPITVSPDVSIDEAANIMFENNFRHLPVVREGRPLGIVSLRLLSRWAFDRSKESVGPPG